MIENLKVLAIIPARGGSKGLKGKNIAPINGIPLIAYSIKAARESKYVDLCLVSSDCPRILEVARAYDSEVLQRPPELASDSASSECVVEHALSCFPSFDLILLLQPTSPLRTCLDIDRAIEALIAYHATAVISVYEPSHTPFKCFKLNERGFLTGLVDNKTPFMRRQDLPLALMPNGAIYLIYNSEFLHHASFFTDKTIPYTMSIEFSADIDTQEDLDHVSKLLEFQDPNHLGEHEIHL
jgi:CMP-N,N'-diacetyllegionaminic acid synthase